MVSFDWRQNAAHELARQGVKKLRVRQRELQAELTQRRANGEGPDHPDYRRTLAEYGKTIDAVNHAVMASDVNAQVGWREVTPPPWGSW